MKKLLSIGIIGAMICQSENALSHARERNIQSVNFFRKKSTIASKVSIDDKTKTLRSSGEFNRIEAFEIQ